MRGERTRNEGARGGVTGLSSNNFHGTADHLRSRCASHGLDKKCSYVGNYAAINIALHNHTNNGPIRIYHIQVGIQSGEANRFLGPILTASDLIPISVHKHSPLFRLSICCNRMVGMQDKSITVWWPLIAKMPVVLHDPGII